jgi:hypothetical protein
VARSIARSTFSSIVTDVLTRIPQKIPPTWRPGQPENVCVVRASRRCQPEPSRKQPASHRRAPRQASTTAKPDCPYRPDRQPHELPPLTLDVSSVPA